MFKYFKLGLAPGLGLITVVVMVVIITSQQGSQNVVQAAQATVTPAAANGKDGSQYLDAFNRSFASHLGVSEDKLNSAYSAAINETLDQMVKDGVLNQTEITKIREAAKAGPKAFLPNVNITLTILTLNL